MSGDPFEGPSWVDRFVLVFVREPTLWPVLLVVIGHVVAFLGPLLLWSVRDGGRTASAVLALLLSLSLAAGVWELRSRGLGALTGLLLASWAASAGAAVAAHHYEFL
jgi:hypothetical protein